MKRLLAALVLYHCLVPLSLAQTGTRPFLCVAGKSFSIPEWARWAGIQGTFWATIAVKDYHPLILSIEPTEATSASPEMLRIPTIENIGNLSFLHDTLSARITIRYKIVPGQTLSTDYMYLDSDSVVVAVFRRESKATHDHVYYVSGDTVTVLGHVRSPERAHGESRILVQRIFHGDSDSTIVKENNYPELREEILSKSLDYSRSDFLQIASEAKVFLIRFHIVRVLSECDWYEEF